MSFYTPSRFEEFLRFRGDSCYMMDYGHGAISFASLEKIYRGWHFVVFESNEKTKAFYFKGSHEKFRRRVEQTIESVVSQYFRIAKEFPALQIWTLGYVPALMTIDFSEDKLGDAIRKDFLKHGCRSYDTGYNILGTICSTRNFFDIRAYKKGRYLDFDFSRWILKERKKMLTKLRKEAVDLV